MKRRSFIQICMLLPMTVKLLAAKGVIMITHPAETRGLADHGWLKSRHTFSFADYYEPTRMGFGALRVINDDSVAAAMGFGTHPHKDMEIISIPLEGALQHRDSEGNSYQIKKGEVQVMSAGTGIYHSEYNASVKDDVKFLQIWVLPKKLGIRPRYEQKTYTLNENELKIVVSPEGFGDSVGINQDAYFSMAKLSMNGKVQYQKKVSGNGVYLFVINGRVELEGKTFKARDGVGIPEFESLEIKGMEASEILLMEVPMQRMFV